MAQVDAVVGNSSSGLYEAPSFGVRPSTSATARRGGCAAASVVHCEPEPRRDPRGDRAALATRLLAASSIPMATATARRASSRCLRACRPAAALLKKHFFTCWSHEHVADSASSSSPRPASTTTARWSWRCNWSTSPADAGADAVKFQTFKADALASRPAPQGRVPGGDHRRGRARSSRCCAARAVDAAHHAR